MSEEALEKQEQQQQEKQGFDAQAYIQRRNEGKAPDKPAEKQPEPEKTAEKTAEEPEHSKGNLAARSLRRQINQLQRELGEYKGMMKAYEQLGIKVPGSAASSETAAAAKADEADPEPARAAFPDDAAYNRAVARWEGRQEAKKVTSAEQEQKALSAHISSMAAKAQEDVKNFTDWEEVRQAALDDGPEVDWNEHINLLGLIAGSEQQAAILYHLAKHPDALEAMLALTPRNADQIRAFSKLEGKVELLYAPKQQDKQQEKAVEPQPRRDARKSPPSESVAPRSGTAPPQKVLPVLADGSVNPQWLAMRNERAGVRP